MEEIYKPKEKMPDDVDEIFNKVKECLSKYIKLLNLIIGVISDEPSCINKRKENTKPDKQVITALVFMLLGVGSSSNTLLLLSRKSGLHTRDCYVIARTIIEGAINICYIISEGKEVAENAIKHAQQKSFRDLDRKSKVGNSEIGLTFDGLSKIRESSDIDDLVSKFTYK